MRREAVRRDELAFRRDPFVWPVSTPPAAMLARVEARASQLQRRRRIAVAVPVPLLLIALLLVSMTPLVSKGERVRTVPPAAEQDAEATPSAVEHNVGDSADGPNAGAGGAGVVRSSSGTTSVSSPVRPTVPGAAPPSQGGVAEPAPLPATGRIAFTREARIWVMNADGTDQRPITPEGEKWGQPSWSPDGRLLATVYDTADARSVILDLRSGTRTYLDERVRDARWSPDGEWIAFTEVSPDVVNWTSSIAVMRADGSDRRVLVAEASYPDWFGSDRLFFMTQRGNELVSIHGRNRRLLPSKFTNFVTGPDGSKVLGMTVGEAGWELWELDATLTGGRRILDRQDMQYDWSHDGEWIAVTRTTSTPWCQATAGEAQAGCWDHVSNIWIVRRDGSGLRQLTTGRFDRELDFGPPA